MVAGLGFVRIFSTQSRLTKKLHGQMGRVQEQKATIASFFFSEEDQARCEACAPGEILRPRFQPAGVRLQVLTKENSALALSVRAETLLQTCDFVIWHLVMS